MRCNQKPTPDSNSQDMLTGYGLSVRIESSRSLYDETLEKVKGSGNRKPLRLRMYGKLLIGRKSKDMFSSSKRGYTKRLNRDRMQRLEGGNVYW